MSCSGTKAAALGATLCAVALGGCEQPIAVPPPALTSVEPNVLPVDTVMTVDLLGENLYVRVVNDIGGRWPRMDDRFVANLGGLALTEIRWVSNRQLEATIPVGLPVGIHDLRVTTPGGQTALLETAITVCDDADRDGVCDPFNVCTDGDGDGVGDGTNGNIDCAIALVDSDDGDITVCADTDGDGCDDCTSTRFDIANDGVDRDKDGICDLGDGCTDADGDQLGNGTLANIDCIDPTTDADDAVATICADTDGDGCDDCSSGLFDPATDGLDTDGDGQCDLGDTDDDGDTVVDTADDDPLDPNICQDLDADTCDDCSVTGGPPDTANDGIDSDGDGVCDALPQPLVLSPPTADITLNSSVPFTASGGVTPYLFSLTSGGGSVDAITGVYWSPGVAGSAVVRVTDAVSQLDEATVTYSGDMLWFVAGTSVPSVGDQVWGTADGQSWSLIGNLPDSRHLGSLITFAGRIWFLGGRNRAVGPSDLIWSSSDGFDWTVEGPLPFELRGTAVVGFNGNMLLIGGKDTAQLNHDEVWSSSDGSTWMTLGTLPAARGYGMAAVHAASIWYLGGTIDGLSAVDDVWSSSDGVTWQIVGTLPGPRFTAAVAVFKGRLWVLGGFDDNVIGTDTVWSSADGIVWTSEAPLPAARAGGSAVVWNDAIWFAGGGALVAGVVDQAYTEVWSTADGVTWTVEEPLPGPRCFGSMATFTP